MYLYNYTVYAGVSSIEFIAPCKMHFAYGLGQVAQLPTQLRQGLQMSSKGF